MIKVLFVCLGNICRSPLAEGIMKHKIKRAGLEDKIAVASAGTSGWHIGEAADPRSADIALQHGIVLDSYGRKAVAGDFMDYDYILAMDQDNYASLKQLASRGAKAALYLMRHYDDIGTGQDVPDPYYGGEDGFQNVYELLDRSCENLLQEIMGKHKFE